LFGGAAAFYGVIGIEKLFDDARAPRRTWYYGDNAYFDCVRGKFYRFSRNAFQAPLPVATITGRAKAQGVVVQPWQTGGAHIVVVEQSPHFTTLAGAGFDWLGRTIAELAKHTDRPMVIRRWQRNKAGASASLKHALRGAHALVTHMSAAANEALIAGVPAFVTGDCAAKKFCHEMLSDIESPNRPDGREEWAEALACSHWTHEELRDGIAWESLRG